MTSTVIRKLYRYVPAAGATGGPDRFLWFTAPCAAGDYEVWEPDPPLSHFVNEEREPLDLLTREDHWTASEASVEEFNTTLLAARTAAVEELVRLTGREDPWFLLAPVPMPQTELCLRGRGGEGLFPYLARQVTGPETQTYTSAFWPLVVYTNQRPDRTARHTESESRLVGAAPEEPAEPRPVGSRDPMAHVASRSLTERVCALLRERQAIYTVVLTTVYPEYDPLDLRPEPGDLYPRWPAELPNAVVYVRDDYSGDQLGVLEHRTIDLTYAEAGGPPAGEFVLFSKHDINARLVCWQDVVASYSARSVFLPGQTNGTRTLIPRNLIAAAERLARLDEEVHRALATVLPRASGKLRALVAKQDRLDGAGLTPGELQDLLGAFLNDVIRWFRGIPCEPLVIYLERELRRGLRDVVDACLWIAPRGAHSDFYGQMRMLQRLDYRLSRREAEDIRRQVTAQHADDPEEQFRALERTAVGEKAVFVVRTLALHKGLWDSPLVRRCMLDVTTLTDLAPFRTRQGLARRVDEKAFKAHFEAFLNEQDAFLARPPGFEEAGGLGQRLVGGVDLNAVGRTVDATALVAVQAMLADILGFRDSGDEVRTSAFLNKITRWMRSVAEYAGDLARRMRDFVQDVQKTPHRLNEPEYQVAAQQLPAAAREAFQLWRHGLGSVLRLPTFTNIRRSPATKMVLEESGRLFTAYAHIAGYHRTVWGTYPQLDPHTIALFICHAAQTASDGYLSVFWPCMDDEKAVIAGLQTLETIHMDRKNELLPAALVRLVRVHKTLSVNAQTACLEVIGGLPQVPENVYADFLRVARINFGARATIRALGALLADSTTDDIISVLRDKVEQFYRDDTLPPALRFGAVQYLRTWEAQGTPAARAHHLKAFRVVLNNLLTRYPLFTRDTVYLLGLDTFHVETRPPDPTPVMSAPPKHVTRAPPEPAKRAREDSHSSRKYRDKRRAFHQLLEAIPGLDENEASSSAGVVPYEPPAADEEFIVVDDDGDDAELRKEDLVAYRNVAGVVRRARRAVGAPTPEALEARMEDRAWMRNVLRTIVLVETALAGQKAPVDFALDHAAKPLLDACAGPLLDTMTFLGTLGERAYRFVQELMTEPGLDPAQLEDYVVYKYSLAWYVLELFSAGDRLLPALVRLALCAPRGFPDSERTRLDTLRKQARVCLRHLGTLADAFLLLSRRPCLSGDTALVWVMTDALHGGGSFDYLKTHYRSLGGSNRFASVAAIHTFARTSGAGATALLDFWMRFMNALPDRAPSEDHAIQDELVSDSMGELLQAPLLQAVRLLNRVDFFAPSGRKLVRLLLFPRPLEATPLPDTTFVLENKLQAFYGSDAYPSTIRHAAAKRLREALLAPDGQPLHANFQHLLAYLQRLDPEAQRLVGAPPAPSPTPELPADPFRAKGLGSVQQHTVLQSLGVRPVLLWGKQFYRKDGRFYSSPASVLHVAVSPGGKAPVTRQPPFSLHQVFPGRAAVVREPVAVLERVAPTARTSCVVYVPDGLVWVAFGAPSAQVVEVEVCHRAGDAPPTNRVETVALPGDSEIFNVYATLLPSGLELCVVCVARTAVVRVGVNLASGHVTMAVLLPQLDYEAVGKAELVGASVVDNRELVLFLYSHAYKTLYALSGALGEVAQRVCRQTERQIPLSSLFPPQDMVAMRFHAHFPNEADVGVWQRVTLHTVDRRDDRTVVLRGAVVWERDGAKEQLEMVLHLTPGREGSIVALTRANWTLAIAQRLRTYKQDYYVLVNTDGSLRVARSAQPVQETYLLNAKSVSQALGLDPAKYIVFSSVLVPETTRVILAFVDRSADEERVALYYVDFFENGDRRADQLLTLSTVQWAHFRQQRGPAHPLVPADYDDLAQ